VECGNKKMGGALETLVMARIPDGAADRRRTAALASVVRMAGKGLGVVARRAMPALTMVAPYPGELLTTAQYDRRLAAGLTSGTYAISFYKPDRNMALRTNYIVDPGAPGGGLLPEYAASAAPRVNEPDAGGAPNTVWVWNLPRHRLELWTARAVARGEELTVCYGNSGGYRRAYRTACFAPGGARAGVEPELHVVTAPRRRPVRYSLLGDAGVAAALRHLRPAT
jgi:hypothetical protein